MAEGTAQLKQQFQSCRLLVEGVVQGVGFRPYVYRLARSLDLRGYVCNTAQGVEIGLQGEASAIATLEKRLPREAPPLARIHAVQHLPWTSGEQHSDFQVTGSRAQGTLSAGVPADSALCADCLRELLDPADRRYYYPLINCTNCGPRFTITRRVPYDRPHTTMASYTMCPACEAEYRDPDNRRFHAQPIACPRCGPRLHMLDHEGRLLGKAVAGDGVRRLLEQAGAALESGKILALKGQGGYHLACDARNQQVVQTLRRRKQREEKPLALLVADITMAQSLVELDDVAAIRLQAADRPILLLRRRADSDVAPSVAPHNPWLGLMLPTTPLQHLLLRHASFPLVMTSANRSQEPIAFRDQDALQRLQGIADLFLFHEREIHVRCDDSLLYLVAGDDYPLRRSRGQVPRPISLPFSLRRSVLALGPQQKNTVCLARGNQALLSQHLGDQDELLARQAFQESLLRLQELSGVEPQLVAVDLHPDYATSRFAQDPPPAFARLRELPLVKVQHHHAHAVSCMADNGLSGEVLAVVLDGTGLGADGSIWGGEILLAGLRDFRRLAALESVPLPGGEVAVRHPWRMALACLIHAWGEEWEAHLPPSLQQLNQDQRAMVYYQVTSGWNSPLTSSCGRLFDAVSVLCGLGTEAAYEGQPAVKLEHNLPSAHQGEPWAFPLVEGELLRVRWSEMIRSLTQEAAKGTPRSRLAWAFHAGLVRGLVAAVLRLVEDTGQQRVVLSGGCFMNLFLLEQLSDQLEQAGLQVFRQRQVPCNDGGLSLGQVLVADQQEGGV